MAGRFFWTKSPKANIDKFFTHLKDASGKQTNLLDKSLGIEGQFKSLRGPYVVHAYFK